MSQIRGPTQGSQFAAVAATVRSAIEDDRYPHARLDPLRPTLARLNAAAEPKAPPPAKADKRARR